MNALSLSVAHTCRVTSLTLYLGLVLALVSHTTLGDSLTTRQNELRQLQSQIEALNKELKSGQAKRDQEREALRQAERKIVEIDARLTQTAEKLKQLSAQHSDLEARRLQQRKHLQQQRDSFGHLVRTTYLVGRQEYLKMLLNQEDPSKLGRAMTYYQYLARARAANIDEITNTLSDLREIETAILTNTEQLESLREAQANDKSGLESHRVQRAQILATLDQRLSDQSGEIDRLRQNERELQTLIVKLQTYVDGLTTKIPGGARFGNMRGKLRLPAKGRIIARFGQRRPVGGLKWEGVLLAAPEGHPIQAIFPGRVIFADWFRGFGLLLILDHGDRYMTLYSHNKTLRKELGDWVEAGDTIAEVGTSGGLRQPGLYFELRHNGRPSDPLLWCKLE